MLYEATKPANRVWFFDQVVSGVKTGTPGFCAGMSILWVFLRSTDHDYDIVADPKFTWKIKFTDDEKDALIQNQNALEDLGGRKGYDSLFKSYNFQVPKADTTSVDAKGVKLMPDLTDVNGILQQGKNLIVIAEVNKVLHFRIFDANSIRVVDTDENQLIGKVQQLKDFKGVLARSWPPKKLEGDAKGRLFGQVAALVGYNGFPEGVYDDVQLEAIADTVSIAATNQPTQKEWYGSTATWFLVRLRAAKNLAGHLVAIEVRGNAFNNQEFRLMDPNNGCFKFDDKSSFKTWLLQLFFKKSGYRQAYTQCVKLHKIISVQPNPESIPTMIFSSITTKIGSW